MLTHKKTGALAGALTAGLLLSASPTVSFAQDAEPAWLNFRIHTVKRDQTAAWESAMRERRDAEEAAGVPFLRIFQRVRGPQGVYLILHLDGQVGQLDLPDVDISSSWGQRLNATIDASTILTVQMFGELTANLDRWLTEDTDMVQVRVRTAAPGRSQDYYDWQAEQLFPALTEAGVSIRGGRVFLGGSSRTFVRLSVVESWASLTEENPVITSRNFERIIAVEDEMLAATEDFMYRYRADLSFVNE